MIDFFNVGLGCLAFSQKVLQSHLGEIIQDAGELLKGRLSDTGEDFFILNPLVIVNCFDKDSSKYRATPDGTVIVQVEKYHFHGNRIGVSLFKIPETFRTCVYASHMAVEPDDEFFRVYNEEQFTGLVFEEVWNDN
ncbi:MAG: hypothetical protein KDM63_14170, partial [Verrucomicrobiae bacterium]|nr:hypothetical protein [Verrucomicrobiae bacterium]